jgi:hypothetical protein
MIPFLQLKKIGTLAFGGLAKTKRGIKEPWCLYPIASLLVEGSEKLNKSITIPKN